MIVRCLFVLSLGGLVASGCGPVERPRADSSDQEFSPAEPVADERTSEASDASVGRLDAAIDAGDWKEARRLSRGVLLTHGRDPDALLLVAEVEMNGGDAAAAADLLAAALEAKDFDDEALAVFATNTNLSAGRVAEAIDLMERTIDRHPKFLNLLRQLHDAYRSTERHGDAIPIARTLIGARRFDLPLLQAFDNRSRRVEASERLDEIVADRPSDPRPLVGSARIALDTQAFDRAIELTGRVLDRYPTDVPANVIHLWALAKGNRWGRFDAALRRAPAAVRGNARVAVAVGDRELARGRTAAAAQSFASATEADPDLRPAWVKFYQAAISAGWSLSDSERDAIERRIANLAELERLHVRLRRFPSSRPTDVLAIARTHRSLGHPWLAEAWAAVASTIPGVDRNAVDQFRTEVVAGLRRDTPFQLRDGRREWTPPIVSRAETASPTIVRDPSAGEAKRSHPAVAAATLRLTDEAQARGLTFFGRTGDNLEQPGVMLFRTTGCGGATIDFDRDGWEDLLLAAAGGTPPARDSAASTLWRNHAGEFVEVGPAASVSDRGFGQGVVVGDVNEDGFADAVILNYGPNTLLINQGDGTFAIADERVDGFAEDESWSTSGAIADFDGDAIADLVVVNYCDTLGPVHSPCPRPGTDLVRSCSPARFPADADAIYRGDGSGRLTSAREAWSFRPRTLGRGLGLVVGPYGPDPSRPLGFLVANDMSVNHFWTGAQRGGGETNDAKQVGASEFELSESAMLRGLSAGEQRLAEGSMGIATADFDFDGTLDFYVTNFIGETNTLHRQVGGGMFRDQSMPSGTAAGTWPMVAFGTQAVDLNNDGVDEIVVTNGHIDDLSVDSPDAVYQQPMQVFAAEAIGRFREVSADVEGDYLRRRHIGRALWNIDADRDGRIDMLVTHQSEPVALLMNRTEPVGNFLEFELVGTDVSRDAIGTVVRVTRGEATLMAARTSGDGYLCGNRAAVHVGLGDWQGRCEVSVTWPDGSLDAFEIDELNRRHLIVQGSRQANRFIVPVSSANK